MKIKQIYIKAFGGLKDFTLNFSSDLQIIYGENESGKTTIQQFIRAMFYDFGKSGYSVETNKRKKYLPWSGESMGGTILFSFQDRDYRLQKIFAEKKSNDQIKLMSDADGEEIHLKNPHQIGIELFNISEAEFLNTVFVDNPDVDRQNISGLDDKLNQKIGLAEYDWSYDEMKNRLQKAEKEIYNERSNKGYIQQLIGQKDNLAEKLSFLLQKDEKIAFLTENIRAKEKQLHHLKQREENLKLQKIQHQKLQTINDFTKLQHLDRDLQQLQYRENLEENSVLKTASVNVKDLTEMATQRQSAAYALSELEIKQNLINNRLQEKKKYSAEQEKQKAKIIEERSRLNYLKKMNMEKKPHEFKAVQMSFAAFIPLIIMEAFLLIGGLLLRKAMPTLSVICIVLAVLLPLLLVFFYFARQRRKENEYKRYQEALRRHQMRTLKIENSLKELEFSLQRIENRSRLYDEEIASLQTQIAKSSEIYEREKNKLKYLIKPYFKELPDDNQLDSAIAFLREKTVDHVQNEEREKYLRQEMKSLRRNLTAAEFYQAYQEAQNWLIEHEEQIRTFPEYSENHIEAQLLGISEERISLTKTLAADKTNLEILEKNPENTFEIETALNEVIEKLQKAQFRYQSLRLALHLLQHSKKTFDQAVRPQLNQKAAEYLSAMTGEAYRDIRIDRNFMIQVQNEDRIFRQQAYYSSGLNDQINLALRLALTEMMQANTKLPLILDDPFIQIDEKRSLNTLKLLYWTAKQQNRQILLFTSQSSIDKILANLDIDAEIRRLYL